MKLQGADKYIPHLLHESCAKDACEDGEKHCENQNSKPERCIQREPLTAWEKWPGRE